MKNLSFDSLFESHFDDLKDFMLQALKEMKVGPNQDTGYKFPAGPIFKMCDAMQYLNMGNTKIKSLIDAGEIAHYFDGKEYRFLKSDLDLFIYANFLRKR